MSASASPLRTVGGPSVVPRTATATRPALYRVAVVAIGVGAFVTLLVLARDATFRGDDWDFIANRSLSDPISLFAPFNEQWVAGGAIVFRLVFAVVGMHSYLPYIAVLLAIHLAVAAGVAYLVDRTSGALPGLLAGAVVAFLGAGNENLNVAFQIGMVLSTALGLWAVVALWAWQRPVAAALLLTLSVACHAIGVVFVALCVVLCLMLPRDRIRFVARFVVPVTTLALWLVAFDLPNLASRGGAFRDSVAAIPAFVAAGGLAAVGATFGLAPQAGVLFLAVLTALAAGVARRPVHVDLAVAAVVAIGIEYCLVAVSRAEFGLGAVLWSRYVYVGVPLVLIAVGAWFGSPARVPERWQAGVSVGLVALCVLAVVGNLVAYVGEREGLVTGYQAERAAMAIIGSGLSDRSPSFDVHTPPPAEARALIRLYGSPARDDLVGGVVSPVPEPLARAVCADMAPSADVTPCLAVVAADVGHH